MSGRGCSVHCQDEGPDGALELLQIKGRTKTEKRDEQLALEACP